MYSTMSECKGLSRTVNLVESKASAVAMEVEGNQMHIGTVHFNGVLER